MVLNDLVVWLGSRLAFGPITAITAITAANPAVVTATGHGLTSGAAVAIASSNSTPTIDGTRTVTVIDVDHFSVPVHTTVAGTTGSFQAGCGTAAIDLFRGELPDAPIAPDLATGMIEYGGLPDDVAFGTADVWRENPRVQFSTRGKPRDYDSGRVRIETVRRQIAQIPWPVTINGVAYWGVRVLQPPFWLRRDEKWRHMHVFNAEFTKDPAA